MTTLISYERQGKTYVTTERGFVDELLYRSYFYTRTDHPEIAPERWAVIYPAWQTLEQRYQQETR